MTDLEKLWPVEVENGEMPAAPLALEKLYVTTGRWLRDNGHPLLPRESIVSGQIGEKPIVTIPPYYTATVSGRSVWGLFPGEAMLLNLGNTLTLKYVPDHWLMTDDVSEPEHVSGSTSYRLDKGSPFRARPIMALETLTLRSFVELGSFNSEQYETERELSYPNSSTPTSTQTNGMTVAECAALQLIAENLSSLE